MASLWQKTLRRNSIELYLPKNDKQAEKIVKRNHRLSIVEEDQSEKYVQHRVSIHVAPPATAAAVHGHKNILQLKVAGTKRARLSSLTAVPSSKPLKEVTQVVIPTDVMQIDEETDGLHQYGADIMVYMRQREIMFHAIISRGQSTEFGMRNKLTNWLLEVLDYVKASQVTVYHAINLLDRSMAVMKLDPKEYQLLAITCVWVSTKLEEYYTADVEDLLKCTMNSYRSRDVIRMERFIYRSLNFACFGEEPTIFVDRLILAASFEGDCRFYELTMLCLDTLVTDFQHWSNLASLKASAAIYIAIHLMAALAEISTSGLNKVWTPSLEYYSGYKETDIMALSLIIVKKLHQVVNRISGSSKDSIRNERSQLDNLGGLVFKYLNHSRHLFILMDEVLDKNVVGKVMNHIVKLT